MQITKKLTSIRKLVSDKTNIVKVFILGNFQQNTNIKISKPYCNHIKKLLYYEVQRSSKELLLETKKSIVLTLLEAKKYLLF